VPPLFQMSHKMVHACPIERQIGRGPQEISVAGRAIEIRVWCRMRVRLNSSLSYPPPPPPKATCDSSQVAFSFSPQLTGFTALATTPLRTFSVLSFGRFWAENGKSPIIRHFSVR